MRFIYEACQFREELALAAELLFGSASWLLRSFALLLLEARPRSRLPLGEWRLAGEDQLLVLVLVPRQRRKVRVSTCRRSIGAREPSLARLRPSILWVILGLLPRPGSVRLGDRRHPEVHLRLIVRQRLLAPAQLAALQRAQELLSRMLLHGDLRIPAPLHLLGVLLVRYLLLRELPPFLLVLVLDTGLPPHLLPHLRPHFPERVVGLRWQFGLQLLWRLLALGELVFILLDLLVNALELASEPEHFLIEPYLLPDVRDQQLELRVTVLEKPLIKLYFIIDVVITLVERLA